jgi:hypothetical protein
MISSFFIIALYYTFLCVVNKKLLASKLKCAASSCLDDNLLAKLDIHELILELVRIKYFKEILQL